jgi:hypothetical protein
MKKLKFLLFNLFAALMIGVAIGNAFAISPVLPSAGIFCAGLVLKTPEGAPAMMAIQKEIWADYLLKKYWKVNQFIQHAFNADSFVFNGKVVHIPVEGSAPATEKNRSVLPATIAKRTDTELTYNIAEFTTDPVLIPNADKYELSYDKMDSVFGDHSSALMEIAAEWMLYDWLTHTGGATTTAAQVRTTGAAVAAHLSTATGNRKKFLKEDLKAARTVMNKSNIPKEDRFALVDSDMLDQLHDDADLMKRDNAQELDLKNGVIDRLYGFSIMERSEVSRFDNAATPVAKDPDAAEAVDDNAAVVCWQKNSVERALGTVEMFENLGRAEYYGDVLSALLRSGGRLRRSKGVVTIIQEATV